MLLHAYFSSLKGFLDEFIDFKVILDEDIAVASMRNSGPINLNQEIKWLI